MFDVLGTMIIVIIIIMMMIIVIIIMMMVIIIMMIIIIVIIIIMITMKISILTRISRKFIHPHLSLLASLLKIIL